jgi:hypothetical protein
MRPPPRASARTFREHASTRLSCMRAECRMQVRHLVWYDGDGRACFGGVVVRDHDLALRRGRVRSCAFSTGLAPILNMCTQDPARRLSNPDGHPARRVYMDALVRPELELACVLVRRREREHQQLQRGPERLLQCVRRVMWKARIEMSRRVARVK